MQKKKKKSVVICYSSLRKIIEVCKDVEGNFHRFSPGFGAMGEMCQRTSSSSSGCDHLYLQLHTASLRVMAGQR